MASEQFSLCWDNFHKNMSSGMNSLLENEDLVDVTLAMEGKYLKAHKMVLSVCSPYFKELFKVNPCKHPIVFMKDVSYVAMSDLLQFMYQGEVQVSQENLTTFIKTAEALQIKGLTGDGNGSAESDIEPVEEAKFVNVPEHHPPARPKKVQSHTVAAPPAKRPRISAHTEQTITPVALTKTESATTSAPTSEQIIQFKMEPYEQNQSVTISDDNPDETFTEDPLDDTNADDNNEDYSMMEGGDDEPQAGTSADGAAGEGQGSSIPARRRKFMRIIHGGFSYHNSVVRTTPPVRYLICSNYTKLSCHGRATMPLNGNMEDIRVTQQHNHPPDNSIIEKNRFYNELKILVETVPNNVGLKKIYESTIKLYPVYTKPTFESLRSSMRRWRRNKRRDEAHSTTVAIKKDNY